MRSKASTPDIEYMYLNETPMGLIVHEIFARTKNKTAKRQPNNKSLYLLINDFPSLSYKIEVLRNMLPKTKYGKYISVLWK